MRTTLTPDGTTIKLYVFVSSDSDTKINSPKIGTEINQNEYQYIQLDDEIYKLSQAYASKFIRYGCVSHRFVVDLSNFTNINTIEVYWDGYMSNDNDQGSAIAIKKNGSWVNEVSPPPSSDDESYEFSGTYDPSEVLVDGTLEFGVYGNVGYGGFTSYVRLYSDQFKVVVDWIPPITKTLKIVNDVAGKVIRMFNLFNHILGPVFNVLKSKSSVKIDTISVVIPFGISNDRITGWEQYPQGSDYSLERIDGFGFCNSIANATLTIETIPTIIGFSFLEEVLLEFYGISSAVVPHIRVEVYNGSDWNVVGTIVFGSSWNWKTLDITSLFLSNPENINSSQYRLIEETGYPTSIDAIQLRIKARKTIPEPSLISNCTFSPYFDTYPFQKKDIQITSSERIVSLRYLNSNGTIYLTCLENREQEWRESSTLHIFTNTIEGVCLTYWKDTLNIDRLLTYYSDSSIAYMRTGTIFPDTIHWGEEEIFGNSLSFFNLCVDRYGYVWRVYCEKDSGTFRLVVSVSSNTFPSNISWINCTIDQNTVDVMYPILLPLKEPDDNVILIWKRKDEETTVPEIAIVDLYFNGSSIIPSEMLDTFTGTFSPDFKALFDDAIVSGAPYGKIHLIDLLRDTSGDEVIFLGHRRFTPNGTTLQTTGISPTVGIITKRKPNFFSVTHVKTTRTREIHVYFDDQCIWTNANLVTEADWNYPKVFLSSIPQGILSSPEDFLGYIWITNAVENKLYQYVEKTASFVLKHFTFTHLIRNFLSNSLKFAYRILHSVIKLFKFTYQTLEFQVKFLLSRYGLRQIASQNIRLFHLLRNLISRSIVFRNEVRNLILKTLNVLYLLRTVIRQTLVSKNDLREFVNKTILLRNRIKSFVSRFLIISYKLKKIVIAQLKIIAGFSGIVTNTLRMFSNIVSYIFQTLKMFYSISNLKTQMLKLSYDLQEIIKQIFRVVYGYYGLRENVLKIIYQIRNYKTSVLSIKYRIRRLISAFLKTKHSLQKLVSISLTSNYSLSSLLRKTLRIVFNVGYFVTRKMKLMYSLLSAPIVRTRILKLIHALKKNISVHLEIKWLLRKVKTSELNIKYSASGIVNRILHLNYKVLRIFAEYVVNVIRIKSIYSAIKEKFVYRLVKRILKR